MVHVRSDTRFAQLATLDVVDVRSDGTLALNETFLMECRAAYDADPSRIGTVIGSQIRDRALDGGLVVEIDLEALTLAALEIGEGDVGP